MTAREDIRTKLMRLRQPEGQLRLPVSVVNLGIEAGIHLLLAAVLAGAVIFQGSAPFALAFVAAAGPGIRGGAALAGACFGYLTMLPLTDGMRYASASILTFAAVFAFYDVKLFRRPWVAPVLAGFLNGFTGLVVRSRAGWRTAEAIWFVLELCLTVLAAELILL